MLNRVYDFTRMQPSLAELKSHLRVTSDDLAGELRSCLLAAIESSEKYIGKIIARSSMTLSVRFSRSIDLPRPLIEVTEVKVDGAIITDYTVNGHILTFGEGVTGGRAEVKCKAGFDNVPSDIKAAVMLRASSLFNNPVDSVQQLQRASDNLLRPYRSWEVDDD